MLESRNMTFTLRNENPVEVSGLYLMYIQEEYEKHLIYVSLANSETLAKWSYYH